mmetsp:Transcript_49009/g.36084  ORF Transcript_49009/g.36084 Transcript_49009/m.36084 type:complete len:95 (+) Transcript_49009:109-393(+)
MGGQIAQNMILTTKCHSQMISAVAVTAYLRLLSSEFKSDPSEIKIQEAIAGFFIKKEPFQMKFTFNLEEVQADLLEINQILQTATELRNSQNQR